MKDQVKPRLFWRVRKFDKSNCEFPFLDKKICFIKKHSKKGSQIWKDRERFVDFLFPTPTSVRVVDQQKLDALAFNVDERVKTGSRTTS